MKKVIGFGLMGIGMILAIIAAIKANGPGGPSVGIKEFLEGRREQPE